MFPSLRNSRIFPTGHHHPNLRLSQGARSTDVVHLLLTRLLCSTKQSRKVPTVFPFLFLFLWRRRRFWRSSPALLLSETNQMSAMSEATSVSNATVLCSSMTSGSSAMIYLYSIQRVAMHTDHLPFHATKHAVSGDSVKPCGSSHCRTQCGYDESMRLLVQDISTLHGL